MGELKLLILAAMIPCGCCVLVYFILVYIFLLLHIGNTVYKRKPSTIAKFDSAVYRSCFSLVATLSVFMICIFIAVIVLISSLATFNSYPKMQ